MSDTPQGKMQVEAVDEARLRKRKRIVTSILAVVSVAVLGGGVYFAWLMTPPAMPTTAEEAMAVAKSMRFQRLSPDAKQPYYDVFREQFGMNQELRRVWREDDELRDAARDMRRQMMEEFSKTYMLANHEERQAMMEGMPWGRPRGGEGRSEGGGEGRGAGGPGGERGGEGRGGGGMRDRISDRLANGSAQGNAVMGEIVQSRRAQRESQQ